MLGLSLILAMLCPAWAGKCKVDWTRTDVEAEGRSIFDGEGRPLRIGAEAGGERVAASISWSGAGPETLQEPGREAGVEWEGDHPVALWTDDGETRLEDRWTWAGGVVATWSRCRWEGGEAQPCVELTYAYDPQGRLVRISDPQGSHLLRWETTHLVEHTWPQSGTVHRLSWDDQHRLESLVEEAGGVEVAERYLRDPRGRVVRREVQAGAVLLEAQVAEYDGDRLVKVGQEQGGETTWLRVLAWDPRGRPTSMTVGEEVTTWSWRGPCDPTVRALVDHLGLTEASPLPSYLAPWQSEDLDLALPWVPSDLPGAANR